ncbi:MAG: hypothetical protein ACI8PZ_006538 [Myxococcota bacterium]|jgi:hypothetical protein
MGTRETLRERPDVPNADIERIIGVAAALQDDDRDRAERPTVAELEEVAAELDIAPEYVEAAIARLKTDQIEATQQAAVAAGEGVQRRRLVLAVSGIALATLLVLIGSGALALQGHVARVTEAEQALVVVLDRQSGLAPQLAALAGSQVDLGPQVAAVRDAESIDDRIDAVEALNTEMAKALARLPPSADASTRATLQHELTGGWNRITVERRRLAEAESRAPSSLRPDVALARLLGF